MADSLCSLSESSDDELPSRSEEPPLLSPRRTPSRSEEDTRWQLDETSGEECTEPAAAAAAHTAHAVSRSRSPLLHGSSTAVPTPGPRPPAPAAPAGKPVRIPSSDSGCEWWQPCLAHKRGDRRQQRALRHMSLFTGVGTDIMVLKAHRPMPCPALPHMLHALPCHAMPCLALPCLAKHAMPCHMPCRALPCHAMPCHAMPCHAICHAKPYAMPCPALPCHAMPCHAICRPWASTRRPS